MNSTRLTPKEKEVLEVIKDLCGNGFPPGKNDLLEEVSMGRRNLTDHLVSLEDKNKVGVYEIVNKKFYFPPSYDQSKIEGYNQLEEEIAKAIDDLGQLLGDIRDPSIEDVADWINRDVEDELFSQIFYKVKESKDLSNPTEKDVDYGKMDLKDKIAKSILWEKGLLPSAKDDPNFNEEKLDEYYSDNQDILESIDVEVNRKDHEVSSVVFEFPKKLRRYTGDRYLTREL